MELGRPTEGCAHQGSIYTGNLDVAAKRANKLWERVDSLVDIGRAYSLWPLSFGLACCAIEMMAMVSPRYDISRFGYEVFRASPRHADVMIVAGTVTNKMAPMLTRIYEQMANPKWVIAMGNCAVSGGAFADSYYVVPGVDRLVPVDIYLTGCPPRPEDLIQSFLELRDRIRGKKGGGVGE